MGNVPFWSTRIYWCCRYAPINPSPCGGLGCGPYRDARDRTPAVRARKHIEYFGATHQKSRIWTIFGPVLPDLEDFQTEKEKK